MNDRPSGLTSAACACKASASAMPAISEWIFRLPQNKTAGPEAGGFITPSGSRYLCIACAAFEAEAFAAFEAATLMNAAGAAWIAASTWLLALSAASDCGAAARGLNAAEGAAIQANMLGAAAIIAMACASAASALAPVALAARS